MTAPSPMTVTYPETSSEVALPTGSNGGTETNLLLSLIEDGSWAEAAHRAANHPIDASRISPDGGGTALHAACMNDAPLTVVNALLVANLGATCVADDDGWTPLHTSCYFDASHEVVRRLLQVNPTVVYAPDSEGRTPIALLSDVTASKWNHDEDGVTTTYASPTRGTEYDGGGNNDDDDEGRIWRKAEMLIMAGYHGTVDHAILTARNKKFRLLHAVAGSLNCPKDFAKRAVTLHPEQLNEDDEDGNLPLHVAAAACQEARHDAHEGKTETESFNIIRFLAEANPKAATTRNRFGALPLHLGIASGCKRWDEGVIAILGAHPAAVVEGEEKTGLYPFMSAAVGVDDDGGAREPHVDTIYQLLRTCPELERFSQWPRPVQMEEKCRKHEDQLGTEYFHASFQSIEKMHTKRSWHHVDWSEMEFSAPASKTPRAA